MKRILIATLACAAAAAGGHALAASPENLAYVPNSLAESTVTQGPWVLHENDTAGTHDASGIVPPSSQTTPPYTGTGTPYAGLCSGSVKTTNAGPSPMQPFYFPFVRRRGELLEGFFDYRPRNQDEATVSATSSDEGLTWTFHGKALALNPYCPWDPTDPDNQNVNVAGNKIAYGSNSANAADNGQGHPTVLTINGVDHLYTLNRATNHIDSDGLTVHRLKGAFPNELSFLPRLGYVSPLASGGYPQLDAEAEVTTGLVNPDAIMGSIDNGPVKTVVYVSKTLNASAKSGYPACPSTPSFALTTLVNGKPRKANDDVTLVRVATTTDGIHFKDLGTVTGLNDPATTALSGIRYLGSGSILQMPNGHVGMFFGAGNCLDNDSDGFHFMGYAETLTPVSKPSDLLHWTIVNGFDNPILSTDTVTDPTSGQRYPANPPLVTDTVDVLSPAQVSPYKPPAGGYGQNFFSGRVYDPQANYIDDHTLSIVFAGYNTPQPSNNLGDYRTIGRLVLRIRK